MSLWFLFFKYEGLSEKNGNLLIVSHKAYLSRHITYQFKPETKIFQSKVSVWKITSGTGSYLSFSRATFPTCAEKWVNNKSFWNFLFHNTNHCIVVTTKWKYSSQVVVHLFPQFEDGIECFSRVKFWVENREVGDQNPRHLNEKFKNSKQLWRKTTAQQ